VLTGIVLSASNPYFLLWWATVGLTLAIKARQLGWIAFVLFTIIHWLCDLVWLGILGWGSFKGSAIFGPKAQRIVLGICGAALILFSIIFIYGASRSWVATAN
jgi:threonine/homoserine/homoserine lactone efflux protein